MVRSKMKPLAPNTSRLSTNIVSFSLTILVLCLAIGLSSGGGGFSNSLDTIKSNMKVVLDDLKSVLPNYTDFIDTHKYLSGGTKFNPKGMSGLYNLTTQFMNWILPQDVLMKELIVWKQVGVYYYPRLNDGVTIGEMLKYYWPLLLVLLILVLITVLVPLVGLFFCCCRCCGHCGARTQPCDKRRDLCKKVCQGTMLIVLGTGLLFCVVCAFASNQQIQEGVDELPGSLKNAYKDSYSYLEGTKDHATNLLNNNYKEFANVFKETVEKSGVHVMQQLNIWSNATAMMDLYNFVEAIPNITVQLGQLKGYTNNLRAMASQLNDAMRKVKRDLLTLLNNCSLEACVQIQKQISNLQTNIDFNRLPDVAPAIDILGKLNLNLLKTAAEEGKSKLDNIERHITSSLNQTLKQALKKVEEAGRTVQANLNKVLNTISDLQNQINSVNGTLEDGYTYLAYYSPYRYYAGLGISCGLLLIAICIVLGLICGICGKRPDGYSDNCCNKGAGGQFLICGVMLMFLFSLVIGVVTLATLALGMASDRGICYPLRHPERSTVLNVVDDYIVKSIKLNKVDIDVKLSTVLNLCYRNDSIYKVFNLAKKFNVDDIRKQFDVESVLDGIKHQLDRIVDPHFTILNNTNLNILRNLSSFDPGINFDHFQDELKENFTNMSLKKLSEVLQKLVDQMEGNIPLASIQSGLKLSILHVTTYDEKILGPMRTKAKEVMDIALHLDSSLKMNSTSFKEAIDKLINEIEDAQRKLREDGSKMLIDAAMSFGNIVKDQVHSFIERVVDVTKNKIGQCGPLNVAINSTLVSTCDKILQPWNGFWVSLFASLLLFIPTIIVSVKLSSLYQKYKQYGQYVETEYLYDAYADRGDSVPLNSRGSKRGKKKKKKGKRPEDRHQMGEVVTREYAAGSQPPDNRYADMAPKHWEEFPNGGPPQYQRAPTEYERPPPYYYPGSGEH
ncbi:prominin-like protein isoform X1 [Diabrotica virgifera virgifera]|uniref:Prominin-like protein n=2 Tax=Diabrotica virgifera virgifera TaxID=50390 RepID=A0ABM5KIM3_DIAVI|nr:prominin-like protein isoform X1 [Diabrotica virgifera virgifera]XP_050510055.1 prominin-like protein isoform X1 [Diabrotica virgifera virgifera]XP_050510060.1 prominin-like protein isoform X1 [Diabrotica virgifera virgifera]